MIETTLAELSLNITDGKHGDCQGENDSGFYFISCKDVKDGQINYNDARQITEKDFLDAHKRTKLEPNDILVTNSGTIGRMAFIRDIPETHRTTFQKSVAIVKPDSGKIMPRYLYYQLQNCMADFINQSNGSAQKNLLLSTMRAFKLWIHEEGKKQERIAEILSAYDDLIENNQKQINLLEEAAQRLYKEWFVDLRFPGHETTTIVDGVPEGWVDRKFTDVVSIMSGGTPKTDNREYYDGNIPFYTPKDSNGAFFAFDTITHISQSGLEHCNSQLYPAGTVIITARGTVGKTTILAVPMAMNQSCYALKCDDLNSPYYLFFALNREVEKLKTMENGGVFNTIIVKTFEQISLMVPPKDVLESFEVVVAPFMEQIKSRMKQIELLRETRDRLLPKLMNGKF